MVASADSPAKLVAHILPYPSIGGTEHATLRVMQAVRPAGFESIAILLHESPDLHALFRSGDFPTLAWPAPEPSVKHGVRFLSASRALAAELKRRKVCLVHCSDYLSAWYTSLAGLLAGIPVLCHVRNRHTLSLRDKLFISPVTHFAFVSRDTWDHFPFHVPKEKGTVIYDGVQPSLAVSPEEQNERQEALKAELKLPVAAKLIGMLARVTPQKDYATLVRAAVRVLKAHPEVRFIVAGDCSATAASRDHYAHVQGLLRQAQVAEHFVFTGYREDVDRLLSCFDISVLSTHWEGLPLALLEAMGHGQPVVATAVDGIPELITDGVSGFLTPHEDADALAARLIQLLDSPATRHHIGENARRTVWKDFTPDRFAMSLRSLYQHLLSPTTR